MLKNWCFGTVVLEKTLESPSDCEETKPISPKGNQSWIFIGRTDAEAPILWPSDVRSWLIGKDPDAGKIEDKRRRRWQRMRWLDSISESMDLTLSKLREIGNRGAWRAAVRGVTKSQTGRSHWTITTGMFINAFRKPLYLYFLGIPVISSTFHFP